jgi:hypothetical protein
MSCPELLVGDKPPLTPQEQAERMLIILAVVVVAVLLLKVIS